MDCALSYFQFKGEKTQARLDGHLLYFLKTWGGGLFVAESPISIPLRSFPQTQTPLKIDLSNFTLICTFILS